MHLSLEQLIGPDRTPQHLAGNFGFTEGPAADKGGNIFFVDIGNHRIHFWNVCEQTLSTICEDSGGADGLFVDAEDSLWICEMHRKRLSKIDKNGEYNIISDSFEGKPFTGPNDLWFDDVGGLYFTDSYAGHEDRGNQTRVFYLAPTGELSMIADDYYKSNGLHGSPDGRWLYIADYLDDKVYRYYMLVPGVLSERKLFAEYRCDGMTVDEHGNVYICTGNSGEGVVVVDPEGHTLGNIELPENPHNICFGGPAYNTLYITATHGLYSLNTKTKGAPNGSPHRHTRDFGGLSDLIQPGSKPQLLTTGFNVAQGPAALPNGDFYFTDIYHNRILKWDFAKQASQVIREDSRGGDGLAVMEDGSLLVCELTGKRFGKITLDGKYEVIADSFEDEPLTGVNDVFIDRYGGIYFSDSYPGLEEDAKPTYCTYYIAPGSDQLQRIVDDLYKGKGIHISPDENWIYMVDYGGRVVYRYELIAPGLLGAREAFIPRMCGGLTLDEYGNIYISTVNDGAGILIYSPEGHLIGQILVPEWTSNVTFAGLERNILIITTAKSVYTMNMQVHGFKYNLRTQARTRMDEVKVCMVGAGSFSTRRIYPYIGAAGGSIAGICTRTLIRAERNARRFGGKPYADVKEMLDNEKPDCVIVCIGPEAHPDMAIRIMEKGYPVYLEKPPAMTSTEAIRMAQVSKQTELLCSIAFKKRYTTVFDRAKAWIGQFPDSDLCSISIDCASGAFKNEGPETSFLLECGIHIIDLILYLYGNVEKVFCFARGMNAYSVNMTFVNGAIGTMNLSDVGSFTIPTEEVEIAVHGGNFMRVHNGTEYKIVENGQSTEWREPPTFMSSGDTGRDTGLFTEIEDFFNAVKQGRSTRSNIFESCKSMLLYEAILESALNESIVIIDYSGIPTL